MIGGTPLVSIITPTFNRASLIGRAISSVQRQTFSNWQMIVVDDGSTDHTVDVVRSRAERDPRIRLVQSVTNSGMPAVARNLGIHQAQGQLIAFLDSDDWWWAQHLEAHVRAHGTMTSPGLCYSHLWSRRPRSPLYGLLFLPSPRQQAQTREQLLQRNSIQCSAVTVSASLLQHVGGFSEAPQLAAIEDYELWLRCSESGPVEFIPRLTGVYSSAQGLSAQLDMESKLAFLGDVIGEPVGRRTRFEVAVERIWGIPAAISSFAVGTFLTR